MWLYYYISQSWGYFFAYYFLVLNKMNLEQFCMSNPVHGTASIIYEAKVWMRPLLNYPTLIWHLASSIKDMRDFFLLYPIFWNSKLTSSNSTQHLSPPLFDPNCHSEKPPPADCKNSGDCSKSRQKSFRKI